MNDESSKPADKQQSSGRKEYRLTGIVAELAGLLSETKVDERDYVEYLAKKYS
jgi:hypothetical protein